MLLRLRPLKIICLIALAHALSQAVAGQPTATPTPDARGLGVRIKVENGGVIELYEQSHALVIGVSEYRDGWPNLPGVSRDVVAVSTALRRQGFKVTELLNPTRVDFDAGMRRFISDYGQSERNRLLVYFAGHGATLSTVDGRQLGYLVPTDAPLVSKGAGRFKQSAVSMTEIENYALEIESRHVLFIFDSCFSGALFEAMRSVPDAIASKSARPVRQFITAGTAEQQVPDESIFRRQFVAALEGEGDLDRDGYVTGSELGYFLETRVTNYSRRAQTPRWGKIRNPALDKGDFVFALPGAVPVPLAPVPRPIDPLAVELLYWESIKNSTDPEDYRSYLKDYPAGRFADIARRRAAPPRPAATPTPVATPTPANSNPATGTDSGTTPATSSSPFFPVRTLVRADAVNNGWTDTGLEVRLGQRLRISATGRVSLGEMRFSTPSGLPRVVDTTKLMRNEPTGMLIAVIGKDNDDFIAIGANREVYAPRSGRLFLGVNEGKLEDNTGSYDALVEVEPVANLPSGTQTQTAAAQQTVDVRADSATNGWTDTGIVVRRGQKVRVTATGRVSLGQGRFSTPAGLPLVLDSGKLMRNQPTGLLIAVIGDDNDEFIAIGTGGEFYAPRDGRFFLGVNEGKLEDNTGTYTARVEVFN